MAEIRTAISIVDGMTPAIKSMNNALNIVVNSFQSLQNTTGKAIDVAAIRAAQSELATVGTSINVMERNLQQSAAAQQNLNNKIREGSGAAGGLVNKIMGMAAAYASMQSAMSLISATDDYTNIGSRLDLINDGLQSTAELQEMVRDSANATFSNYKDTADMVGKLGVQAGDAFKNNQDIINFAEQINKHLSIAGTSGAAAQGAMIQLTQAMSNGVLRGEELNSVMDGMPTVAKVIEAEFRKMGDSRPIKEIAEDGLISAEMVKQALYNAADDTNKKFEQMGVTFTDVWNLFKNSADKAMTPVYKKLSELTSNKSFQQFAIAAGNAVSTLAGVLIWAFDTIAAVGQFVANNWGIIAPILWGVTAAVIAYNAALLYNNTLQGISAARKAANAFLTAFLNAKIMMATGATFAQTAAQWGLNAALLACPLTWIVAAIIAVIVVIYLAVAAINHFAGTSISATGIIAGAFMALYAYIYNIVINLWNTFVVFAEFLINVFQNPIYSIKALFINLATNFLDGCIAMTSGWDSFATSIANAFISAINTVVNAWNGFMDMLPDKVKSSLGLGKGTTIAARTSITSDLGNAKSNLQGMLGDKPGNYGSLPRLAFKSVGESAVTGYKWGENLGSKASLEGLMQQATGAQQQTKGTAEMTKNAGMGAGSPAAALGKETAKNTGKTAGNTAAMADSLAASDEDIKLLRDIAEREVINRFTTAEIKVDMTNNNNISNGMDIDGVISTLTDKLYDTMAVAAEGVHI